MTKTACKTIKVCHNTALCTILGVPRRTSIDAIENELRLPPLNVRFSILTAQFIVKVFSNSEHPLHKSLTVASKKDPRVFSKKHWDIKATRTMLDLLRGSPIPVIQPKHLHGKNTLLSLTFIILISQNQNSLPKRHVSSLKTICYP